MKELAKRYLGYFEKAKRESGTEYWKRAARSPHYVQDFCRCVHGDAIPNDSIYRFMVESLMALSDGEKVIDEDCYTHELLDWLRDDPEATSFVDEHIKGAQDLNAALMQGQWERKQQIMARVVEWLDENDE